jgi:hypothetical protein
MTRSDSVTLQCLQGGTKWHCPDVDCRYVSDADLSLGGETREVCWDGETVRKSDGEQMALANVCNYCQMQLEWTSAGERFAAVRRQYGASDPPDPRQGTGRGPRGEDS